MDGSDCRGYRTTRRNLPSSIAYRPPFTAISRNIGVIDMQTSHTTASAAATTSLARRIVAASWKPVLFAVLMWLSAAAGEIPIPGTPVPITLQTFVVMLAGLMLPWRQAGAAVATYLAAGAVGLPVFAGGTSTLALVGPSAGFLFGFLPAGRFVATALVRLEVGLRQGQIWVGGVPDVLRVDDAGRVVQRFISSGLPLGILPSTEILIEHETFTWDAPCQIMLCSDGFTEAENAGGEPFGATGLEQALLDSPRAGRVNSLCAALTRHLGSQTATDDVSLLILDCASPGEGTG